MEAKRVTREFTQTNNAPPDRVFPLLCPVREADWVPGWEYRLVYSQSGIAELGCVFTTPNPDGVDSTWIVTEYEPPRRTAFAWVWPNMIATLIEIQLEPAGAQTKVHIRYTYTALSDAGARELARYDRAWFESKMTSWEKAINHYLRTGKAIAAGAWE